MREYERDGGGARKEPEEDVRDRSLALDAVAHGVEDVDGAWGARIAFGAVIARLVRSWLKAQLHKYQGFASAWVGERQ